ncbi:thiamine phosphate synthase [Lacibacterium aquatile]|uniref:Thiamine phosphate synthase n=1 Tax=Lacibacterium aquatile TaxID=1168082 RepID=A0ABW5DLX1_9PROT
MSEETYAPRLYLILPATTEPSALAALLKAGDVACVAVSGSADQARGLLATVREADRAFVLIGSGADAARIDADGVHLVAPKDYAAARKALGAEQICGVNAGTSMHVAMEAAEQGADYIALSPQTDLIDFWVEAMTVPCVAWDVSDEKTAAAMVDAGADFIALSGALATVDGVTAVQKLIDAAG